MEKQDEPKGYRPWRMGQAKSCGNPGKWDEELFRSRRNILDKFDEIVSNLFGKDCHNGAMLFNVILLVAKVLT